jgi:universal bacterial protein YeaZ
MSDAQGRTGGLTLALDAAEGMLEIGIADENGRMLFSSLVDAPSRGVEILTPAIASAFSLIGRDVAETKRIAVVRGPGGFTGIRLATTTAAGLARATGALQAGLDYMDCLARRCLPSLSVMDAPTQLWILVRARRDLVYVKGYAKGYAKTGAYAKGQESPLVHLGPLAVLPVSSGEAADHILTAASLHKAPRVLLAGSGVRENSEILAQGLSVIPGTRASFLDITVPLPETLLRMAGECAYSTEDVEPLYVRVADAETNLPQIAERLGLDPGEAARKLHELTHALPDEN